MDATTNPLGTQDLAVRLERGELICWNICPFPLPTGDDRDLLLRQRLNTVHKNIALDVATGRLTGYRGQPQEQVEWLKVVLERFGCQATSWLERQLPQYATDWRRDFVTLRPEEEATRPLRRNARNDLLHIDAFPTRPSHGDRLLRMYVNINPSDERVWVTSDSFRTLFERYGARLLGRVPLFRNQALRRFGATDEAEFDRFMLRLHDFLKSNDDFQERCRKRYWKFPPGSMWLGFTDGFAHAVLRGRYALEHSWFVPRACLTLPEEAPFAIWQNARQHRLAA